MKPHACDQCDYRSNYKHDLKRHQKVHSTQSYSKSRDDNQQYISTSGFPVQALNLSNNINVPHATPNQVINIQPPPIHSPHTKPLISPIEVKKKKPVIHDISSRKFDLRLKENFKLFISGPSRSGKTVFVKDLIKNLDILAKAPPKIITLVYKVDQPIYHEMNIDHLVQDGPNLKQRLFQIAQGDSMLCIFDDMMNSESLSDLANLFVVDGRHLNLSLVFISQRIFANSEEFRQISQNCDYFSLFRNPRNAQEIRTLASQMSPGKLELVKYFAEATQDPFSYLWLNLTQECHPAVKYLSHLFFTPHVVRTYNNGKMEEMSDLLNNGRTNFSEMYFKTNFHNPSSNLPHDPGDKPSVGSDDSNIATISTDPLIPPSESHFDEEANEIEMRERLRRLREDWSDYTPAEEWDHEEDRRILRNLNSKDVAVETDGIGVRNVGVQSDEIRTHATGTDPDPKVTNSRNVAVGTDRIGARNVGVQSEGIITHNTGTGTPPGPITSSIGTDPISGPSRRNIGTDPELNLRNRSDAEESNSPAILQGGREETPMEITQTSKEIRPYESTRAQRHWRLNAPLGDLISMSNRYRNYNTYAYLDGNTQPTNANHSIVPYRRYDQEVGGNLPKCAECGDIFRSARALETHRYSCKPSVFACSLCGKNLPTRNAWQSHVRNMHQTRKDVINKSLDRIIRRR